MESNERGQAFEERVGRLLFALMDCHRSFVRVQRQASYSTHSGRTFRNDFELEVRLHHETAFYFIECQDRSAASLSILDKIKTTRAESARQTFMFVHEHEISPNHLEQFEKSGVTTCSFRKFMFFALSLHKTITAIHANLGLPPTPFGNESAPAALSSLIELPRSARISSNYDSRPDESATKSRDMLDELVRIFSEVMKKEGAPTHHLRGT